MAARGNTIYLVIRDEKSKDSEYNGTEVLKAFRNENAACKFALMEAIQEFELDESCIPIVGNFWAGIGRDDDHHSVNFRIKSIDINETDVESEEVQLDLAELNRLYTDQVQE